MARFRSELPDLSDDQAVIINRLFAGDTFKPMKIWSAEYPYII